jgi:thymidine phosphorylase
MLVQDIIAAKRDGQRLSEDQIQAFVAGLSAQGEAAPAVSDAQAAAMAMAIVCRGMDAAETACLTRAMTGSGQVLRWREAQAKPRAGSPAGTTEPSLRAPDGVPVLDKHSTGGVGDKVSLMLAPIVAACGAWVPMVSGRGLAHTGGTLDKLESLPGFRVDLSPQALQTVMHQSGCAIVSASPQLAPADRRLYAIRDVTATVASLPLITASILSKKLAAGLEGLVMDVKVGRGAFMATLPEAQALARSLVDVAGQAGLPTVALITDMAEPLGLTAGNTLEVQEAIDFLTGRVQDTRLRTLTLALSAELLLLGRMASSPAQALAAAAHALDSGRAAEHFARLVAAQGGPADVLRAPGLPQAPVVRHLAAERAGWLARVDTLALGWQVVTLGGGRRRPGEAIDPRVGLSGWPRVGQRLERGDTLVQVHAASEAAAQQALQSLAQAFVLADEPPQGSAAAREAIVLERLAGAP